MMILAYFRMKFSSLKMKSERVLEAPMPGRLMVVARLDADRSEESPPPPPPPPRPMASSPIPVPSADRLAILVKESMATSDVKIWWVFSSSVKRL